MIIRCFKSRLLIALLIGFFLVAFTDAAWACPTCKDNLGSGDSNMASAYGWSIVFMMSMPFLILGGFLGFFYLEVRRAKAKQPREQSSPANTEAAGINLKNVAADHPLTRQSIEKQPLEV